MDLSFTFCSLTIEESEDELSTVLHDENVPVDVRAFVVDRDMAGLRAIVSELTGGALPLLRLESRRPAPAHVRPTLRRRLAAEGASYRGLVDEVREALAEELLVAGIPVEQVSRRLGYAETCSFTHAFTRWKGSSPRVFARARR